MGGSSTSPTRRSPGSRRSLKASARSTSTGERPERLGRSALRDLAVRHGIRPTRKRGQHFLADPNLARAIVTDAGVAEGDRVLEVGAGLGSLTVPLAEAGCRVLAIEVDPRLSEALHEVVAGAANVRIQVADAMRLDWPSTLGTGRWAMVSNLPYNVSVPLVLELMDSAPSIDRYVVMVQREVGERLVAGPGDEAYGAVSVRVAYRADARVVRRVPADVFWPRPKVDSVLVRLDVRPPSVAVDPTALFAVVDEGFAERRKTMANALRRLGLDAADAADVLRAADLDPSTRAERLGLDGFARIAATMLRRGWTP
ncbi:MAG: 16S rRNA (adenine(1518)-N(6)/adenine(1519)-N(6))-dimethyltransferase RsmA [Actinomycetota bacterium]